MPRRELAAVEQAQHLVEVAPGAHGVGEHGLHALVRADHEHRAHGGVVHRRAAFGAVAGVLRQHVEQFGDGEGRVADERIGDGVALGLFDVLQPRLVVGDGIHGKADDLAVAGGEVLREARHVAELGGADRREVLGVREQDGPAIADPVVEGDGALGGLGGEVGHFAVDAQGHGVSSFLLGCLGVALPRMRAMLPGAALPPQSRRGAFAPGDAGSMASWIP